MAFRAGGASRIDDRAYHLDLCKTLPTQYLMQILYPDLYPIHTIEDKVIYYIDECSGKISCVNCPILTFIRIYVVY